MKSKNPNRYGKGNRNISTTVPEEIYKKIEELAAAGGIKITAWARAALIQEARKAEIFSLQAISKHPIYAPPIAPATNPIQNPNNGQGDICALPDFGLLPADHQTPIQEKTQK